MATPDKGAAYETRLAHLRKELANASGPLRLAKATISNRFRYQPLRRPQAGAISLQDFNHVLDVDTERATVDVEGLATYAQIVDATLPHGLLPTVAPELKHITVGGATVGIGIESTCFRHGFVHDGLLEADVLLPTRQIVTCRPDGEHAALFHALPNSYGTLGYLLRLRVRLVPAQPFVRIDIHRFDESGAYLDAMREATADDDLDFIEGLVFARDEFLLMTATFVDEAARVDDIVRDSVFYRLARARSTIYLTTRDYIFRYDPEWFWNIPDGVFYRAFRRYAPRRLRNSSFYTRYSAVKSALLGWLPAAAQSTEPLIQDWQVPWDRGKELLDYALENIDLEGRPWAAVPIRPLSTPTLYPIRADTLYFNLGCYTYIRRAAGAEPFHSTRIMDRRCFDLGGLKMLYSSTFLDRDEFDRIYNGEAYARLKQRYDPDGNSQTLFEKT